MGKMQKRFGLIVALAFGGWAGCSDDSNGIDCDEATAIDGSFPDGGSYLSSSDASADGQVPPDAAVSDGGWQGGGASQDSGLPDSGTMDSGARDSGIADSGSRDSGTIDSGKADTGTADTGTRDTGTADTSTRDTGTPDTGRPDTGAPDTGTADTSVPDTGTAGSPDTGTGAGGPTDSGANQVAQDSSVSIDSSAPGSDSGSVDSGGPATDSGASDSAMADTGSQSGGGFTHSAECQACLTTSCTNYLDSIPALSDCSDALCQQIVTCFENAHLVTNTLDVTKPYCGDVSLDDCTVTSYVPNGPCKALVEQGFDTTDKDAVLERWIDPAYVGGKAVYLVTCESDLCPAQCLQ